MSKKKDLTDKVAKSLDYWWQDAELYAWYKSEKKQLSATVHKQFEKKYGKKSGSSPSVAQLTRAGDLQQ